MSLLSMYQSAAPAASTSTTCLRPYPKSFRARFTLPAASSPTIQPTIAHPSATIPPTSSLPTAPPPAPSSPSRRTHLLLLLLAASAAPPLSLPPLPAVAAASSTDPGDWSSPGLGAPVDPSQPRFVKLPSGVRFQELNVGSGPIAAPGDTVLFDYVLRRSNGYFIYGTVEGVSFQPRDVPTAPVSFKLGGGDLIPGLEEVLVGMAPGSKRRALIPPELGYVAGPEQPQPPTFATRRQLDNHKREPLLFEVQMLRVGGKK